MANKKLYRKRDDKVIGGVCAGLADYLDLDVDTTVVRIIVVASVFALGTGLGLYLLLWLLIPLEPEKTTTEDDLDEQ